MKSMYYVGDVSSNENNGQVSGIHQSNQLGPGIQIASIEELGPGNELFLDAMADLFFFRPHSLFIT